MLATASLCTGIGQVQLHPDMQAVLDTLPSWTSWIIPESTLVAVVIEHVQEIGHVRHTISIGIADAIGIPEVDQDVE
jgi:hypothetical protein